MKEAKATKRSPKKPAKADMKIGSRIQQYRIAMNVTQQDLGEALGLTLQQIRKYESGINRVTGNRLRQIAATLEVPFTCFLDKTPAPREVESLLLLENALTLRLLRAYSRIKDAKMRRTSVVLFEQIAANQLD